ncbi:amidohydrolase family protein [Cnuibacter physcomitrellae]|uniref:amidohydrolase family protein n=1 Tax=Cnuibacter physcomitrellae TaxID=1619308 RepID=UPI0021757740|nr:amidohydrolase family protein [Cnuibacter physcomitrellae]MCS5498265.1 amidohydrolase family protein [Cnuibacter physcomitrellae]
MTITAVVGGRVWTPGADVIPDGVVIVTDGTISAVGARDTTPMPEGATLVDATGTTVVPGLIDMHVHLSGNSDRRIRDTGGDYLANATIATKTLDAFRNAQRGLMAGFTTLRSISTQDGGQLELRDFAARGLLMIPRLFVAPWWLTMTGGHGDLFYPTWYQRRQWDTADGVDGVRLAVRKQLSIGADFIKVMASGGTLSHGDKPTWPNYTTAEIEAAVDEAHTYDLKVAAHAHSIEGIERSLDAGVDSIEHGTYMTDEQHVRMVETGTFLVPTLSISDWVVSQGANSGATPEHVERAHAMRENRRAAFVRAHEAGVRIAMGTDGGSYAPLGANARELELYVELGLTPAEALTTATATAADLLGRSDLGRLEPGAVGDVVCVEGDLLADISLLRVRGGIRTILKDGRDVTNAGLVSTELFPELAGSA